jgi:hypothetical protein
MKKIVIVTLLGGGSLVGAAWLAHSRAASARSGAPVARSGGSESSTPADLERLSKDLKRIERSVARLNNGVQQNATRVELLSSAPPAAGDAPSDVPAPLPEELEKEAVATQQRQLATLRERLQAELADPSWSGSTETDIQTAIRENLPGSTLLASSCKTTVCKVVVQHAAPQAQASLVTMIATQPPFRAGVVYEFDTEARPPTTTLWVLRDQDVVAGL